MMDPNEHTAWLRARLVPEFRLLTECVGVNFANPPARQEGRDLPESLDWRLFVDLTRRHRVQGLAWNGLRLLSIDPLAEVSSTLESAAREVAEQSLRAALHSNQLRDAFTARSIPILFLKGLVIGARAYRDPMLKSGRDIDIVVPPVDLQESVSVLRATGHRPIHPVACDKDIVRWHGLSKESVWRSANEQLIVELHTGLTDHTHLLSKVNLCSEKSLVEVIPGSFLPTLANDEQFAYLCVHGASSAWFRLKWIADLAGVISGASEDELRRLVEAGRKLGAGRSVDQALLLACWLFPVLSHDSPLARELHAERVSSWLAKRSLSQLLGPEPASKRLGTATIHLTQLFLTRRWTDGMSELARQLRFPWHRRAFRFED